MAVASLFWVFSSALDLVVNISEKEGLADVDLDVDIIEKEGLLMESFLSEKHDNDDSEPRQDVTDDDGLLSM